MINQSNIFQYPRFNRPILPPLSDQPLSKSTLEWARALVLAEMNESTIRFVKIRERPWSRVYAVETLGGTPCFLKIPDQSFRAEATITKAVRSLYPAHCVEVLGAEATTGAFLSRSAGDVTLRQKLRLMFANEILISVVQSYSEMQAQSQSSVKAFLLAGAPDWSADHLNDELQLVLGSPGFLKNTQLMIGSFRGIAGCESAIQRWCSELTVLGDERCVEHGDFQENNIVLNGEVWKLIDWGDMSISHPLFSLATFCHSLQLAHGQGRMDETLKGIVMDKYLEPWKGRFEDEIIWRQLRAVHCLFPILCILKMGRLMRMESQNVHAYASVLIDYWLEVLVNVSSAEM